MEGLLNWLWQGGVVAAASAVVLRVLRRSRARTRYALLWVALVAVVLLPVLSLLPAGAPAGDATSSLGAAPRPLVSLPDTWWLRALPLALCAAWSLVFALRVAHAAFVVRREKKRCGPFPVAREARLACWGAIRGTGRRTPLVLSKGVGAAAVLGCGSPVVAVAPALVDALTDAELDRVVVHEWAHVQRYDDLANALQAAVRVAAGWHPALWWLDRRMRIERELACDELAASLTGSAKAYAACLARLATVATRFPHPPAALAALAAGGVRERVVRVLESGRPVPVRVRVVALVAAVMPFPLAWAVSGLPLVEVAPVAGVPATAVERSGPGVVARLPHAPAPLRPILITPGWSDAASAPARFGQGAGEREAEDAGGRPRVEPAVLEAAAMSAVGVRTSPVAFDVPSAAPIESRPAVALAVLHAGSGATGDGAAAASPPPPLPSVAIEPTTVWGAAADAGVAIGRGSQNAAIATAGFFTRVGKSIAGSF